jgi:hypothetical protein
MRNTASRSLHGALLVLAVMVPIARAAQAQGQPAPPAQPPPAQPPPAQPAPAQPPAPAAPPPAAPPTAPDAKPPEAAPAAPASDPATPAPSDAPAERAGAPAESDSGGGGLFEQAQADADTGGESGGLGLPFELNGYVRGDAYIGKVPAGDGAWETKAAYGEVSLKLRTKKEKFGDAYAETRFRYGLQSEQTNAVIDVREAYVNGYFGPVDVRLGQQVIVWGRADAFNPTNNLMPFDLRVRSPVEDDRRVGNLAARAFLNFAPVRIEGVWVPLYRPAEIPTVTVPWYVNFTESDFPPADLKNGTEAVRVHLELPSFEMSVSYLYGYAPLPGLAYSYLALGTPDPIHIKRQAYDQHVIGLDFSTAIGDFMGVRGEAAFRNPLHYKTRVHAPDPDLQYVLGLDRTFGSVSVIAQYMGRYVFDWTKAPSEPLTPDQEDAIRSATDPEAWAPWAGTPQEDFDDARAEAEAFAVPELLARNQMLFSQLYRVQHLVSVRIEWLTLHDTLSLSAFGFVNFNTEEWLVFPKVGYHLSDNLSATVGAEVYGGPSGTLFGLIDAELSAGYAELRYAF